MANYKAMYCVLFNAITDVIEILQKAQQDTEEIFISADEPAMRILSPADSGNNGKKP